MTIGFIGNFIPTYSTEADRAWSFEKLGHTVIRLQENKTTAARLLELMPKLDMLIYSHTHDPSYVIDGLIKVFDEYKKYNVPTVSVHLDRWLGLNRESDMGKEATWFTEYIFMADGSPEAARKYTELDLNWYWLKPGVIERDCRYLPQQTVNGLKLYEYPEIVFTGSKGYHPEHPFRPQLIDWLHQTYDHRFIHYGNDGVRVIRESALNDLYSNAKIVVGDSCFGGRPRYVSDRYYEVRGRGGFLIHPHQEDIDTVGVANYEFGNLEDLKRVIDYYLEHDAEREEMRMKGFIHVKNNETYTHRAEEIIERVINA